MALDTAKLDAALAKADALGARMDDVARRMDAKEPSITEAQARQIANEVKSQKRNPMTNKPMGEVASLFGVSKLNKADVNLIVKFMVGG
jgi:hypothetical protein